MTGFPLTAEPRQLRELAAQVAREVYAPKAAQWDLHRTLLPGDEVRRLAELGFLGIVHDEKYGGLGSPLVDALIVIEELAKECRPAAFQVFEANTGPNRVIEFFGTEEQRKQILPRVVSGEATVAVAISEPDAGSAATDMRTRARKDGDGYVVNGTKRWISGGGHATCCTSACCYRSCCLPCPPTRVRDADLRIPKNASWYSAGRRASVPSASRPCRYPLLLIGYVPAITALTSRCLVSRVAGPPAQRTTPVPACHRAYIGYGQAIAAGSAAKKAEISRSLISACTGGTVQIHVIDNQDYPEV